VGIVLVTLGLLARILMPRFMICLPVAFRLNAPNGCWILASKELGMLPSGKVYWQIDRFTDRPSAEAARGLNGTVVESYGKVWLFTVVPDASAPTPGEHVATIGPLSTDPDQKYTAVYMEGTFLPGMRSIVHRHPGPEAFYNLEGEFCLETPGKQTVVGPGESVFVEGGTPMELTATGTAIRRSLVLILRSSNHMVGTPAFDWRPKGLCKRLVGGSAAFPLMTQHS
jgi:quercetin dioxygenase-like cupin family protein